MGGSLGRAAGQRAAEPGGVRPRTRGAGRPMAMPAVATLGFALNLWAWALLRISNPTLG